MPKHRKETTRHRDCMCDVLMALAVGAPPLPVTCDKLETVCASFEKCLPMKEGTGQRIPVRNKARNLEGQPREMACREKLALLEVSNTVTLRQLASCPQLHDCTCSTRRKPAFYSR